MKLLKYQGKQFLLMVLKSKRMLINIPLYAKNMAKLLMKIANLVEWSYVQDIDIRP